MKSKRSFFLLVVVFLLAGSSLTARRPVKIATIGMVNPSLDTTLSYQRRVDIMIDHIRMEIGQVLPDKPDLIVLPEACDRPAGMTHDQQMKYYSVRGTQVKDFLAGVAKENHCYIAFGMKAKDEKGIWRNSCFLLGRSGKVAGRYDKNFPTPGEMEGGIIASDKAELIHTDFGDVACAICFDLNFDELRERYAELRPDLIIFVSMYHGGLVQAQWAYSCRSWFVSSVGIRNLLSQVRNPLGKVVATTTNYYDHIVTTVNLDYELAHLDHNWTKLDALKAKYGEEVTIYDPGEIGVVMITSESEKVSAAQMVEEFGIEKVDHYFDRTRVDRKDQLTDPVYAK